MTTEQRRLAAILVADVVGYSKLVGSDEVGTLAKLGALRREIIEPTIAKHTGRLFKSVGDGFLVEFASAVQAVTCAKAIQEGNGNGPLPLRIGIHIGDVVVQGDDLMGDGVNVAARIEGIADPGGITITRAVHEQVRDKLNLAFIDKGEIELKNIARPVQVFVVEGAKVGVQAAALPLPDKPSIAVLPFQNMSGDPEQEYFADGVAEDVLTTLSKIEELMVIARNSSFVFKNQSKDVREIGRILGVRYVLEGSVRKSGNRVRLTAQLIDSLDGSHVWADRFDGDLDDVFELQDRITQDIVTALEVRLAFGEDARVRRKRSGSPMVYEHFSKAMSYYIQFGKHTHAQAKEACERALAINPGYTQALLFLGYTLVDQARFGWVADAAAAYKAALECADRALQADPECSDGYMVKGYVCLFLRRHDEATEAGQKAIALSPGSAGAYHMAGMFFGFAGDFRKATTYAQQANRLSPLSWPNLLVEEARARFHLGDFAGARDIGLRAWKARRRWLTAQTIVIAALWNLGSKNEARNATKELLAEHPNFSVSRLARGLPYKCQEDLEALVAPLRLAGLPE